MLENPLLQNKYEIKSKVLGENIINLLDKTFLMPYVFDYNVVTVTSDFIGRMDLISKQAYGTDKYQDVLCKLNGISNPFELNEGDVLILPDVSELYKFYYSQTNSEMEEDTENTKELPTAKAKNEKRKPNEAVIGEKRFKIDSSRKVVIY